MLGKLMKHEWQSVWKVPTLLIGILLVTAILCASTFALPMWKSNWIGLPFSMIFTFMAYYMAIIVCSVGVSVYLAVRFYQSMFTDEGYLTHTLPATSHQLLISKVLTMFCWNLISIVAVVVSILIFFVSMFFLVEGNFNEMGYMVRSMMHELAQLRELEGLIGLLITMIVLFFASAFSGTMLLVGAISIGQMLRKHRILGAIGAYFGINTVMQVVSTIVMFPIMFGVGMRNEPDDMISGMIGTYWGMALVSIAMGVGLYFLSEYLIRRQLDLE